MRDRIKSQRDALLNAALEYIEDGWSVIPLNPHDKRPLNKWREYQDRVASEEEVVGWFDKHEEIALGLATGKTSNVVVIDCDSDSAIEFAKERGLTSPFSARSGRGPHYYFSHPGSDVRNQQGLWGCDDIDLRGDGGYVVVPPSICKSKTGQYVEYRWDNQPGLDWHDDAPRYPLSPSVVEKPVGDELPDLTNIAAGAETASSIAALTVERLGRKIGQGEGGGRDNLLIKYAGECVAAGVRGYVLRDALHEFMDEYFLPNPDIDQSEYVEQKAKSAEEADRRNHPERYVERAPKPKVPLRPIFTSDIPRLQTMVGDQQYLIDPWLKAGSIIQLYAYSGAGKSRFIQTVMWHLSMGNTIGGFDIERPARVLYLDYELGLESVSSRFRLLQDSYGNPGEEYGHWSPAVLAQEEGGVMPLGTPDGNKLLQDWITSYNPEVVVIDTLRSAWAGLEENDANAWTPVNRLLMAIRNTGRAVVMIHHANKGGADGLGREAGSTNQLTNLDLQMRLTPIYEDAERADQFNGLVDKPDNLGETMTQQLTRKAGELSNGSRLLDAYRLTYHKTRDRNENMRTIHFGTGERTDGTQFFVSQNSLKQRVRILAARGTSAFDIAQHPDVMVSVRTIEEWINV